MLDESLASMEGHSLPNTPEDIADSRRTVEWLNTPEGMRAARAVVEPALSRTLANPRPDTLKRTPRPRL